MLFVLSFTERARRDVLFFLMCPAAQPDHVSFISRFVLYSMNVFVSFARAHRGGV